MVATKGSTNEFLLGSFINSANPKAETFYVGEGNGDYAQIQNFTKSKDAILLAGQPSQYKFESTGGTFRISTANGDLVAIIEGVDKLEVGEISKEYGMFEMR